MFPPDIKNLHDSFQKKGQERLTLMLVPHEGQQIFSLQLNWITIIVLSSLFAALLALAIFSFYEKQKYIHEKEQLIQLYGNKLKSTIKIESLSRENEEEYETLLEKIEDLSLGIGISQKEIDLLRRWEQKRIKEGTLKKAGTESRLSPRTEVLPAIPILRDIYSHTKNQLALLNKLHHWHSRGFGVYQKIPLGRPFRSFQSLRDTSGFGKRTNPISRSGSEFHNGYDTAGPLGTPVYATARGIVHKSYHHPNGYGRTVIIEHGYAFYSAYAHLASLNVRKGTKVRKGQKIGTMGNSGRVTGVHLHYEIHRGLGKRINPRHFICIEDFYTNSCLRYHNRQND